MIKLRSLLPEDLISDEDSKAAQQAHELGLQKKGWGYWIDKAGNVVAKTVNGVLTKLQGPEAAYDKGHSYFNKKRKEVGPDNYNWMELNPDEIETRKNMLPYEDELRKRIYAKNLDFADQVRKKIEPPNEISDDELDAQGRRIFPGVPTEKPREDPVYNRSPKNYLPGPWRNT